MQAFQTLDKRQEAARASIAADLATLYSELSKPKDSEKFSLVRALRLMSEEKLQDCYEADVLKASAVAQGSHFDKQRVQIPWGILGRDMTVGVPSAGGNLVGNRVTSAADVLRPFSLVTRLGISTNENLTMTMGVPNLSSATTGQWLATETSAITANNGVIGLTSSAPKTAGALIKASRQFMIQGATSDAFIKQQLVSAMGVLLDLAVLQGTGASGQPTGLLSAAGVGTQTGAVTFANQLDILKTLADANVNEENIKFVTTPALRRILQERPAVASTGYMLAMDGKSAAEQKPFLASTHCPTSTIFAGDWSQCLVNFWGSGLQIEVDPYTSFTTGAVQVRVLMHADVSFIKPTAFVRHTSAT
jgi:HK97 family phage major capsid protein